MAKDEKKTLGGFDSWSKRIDELAKDVTDENFDEGLEEITSQIERGDYSSLDPELRREIEEREQREKKKRVAKPKGKAQSSTV